MSIDFAEYVSCLNEEDHTHLEALESSYHEAARVMSPRGLQNYLEGMRAMCTMGRGQDLVLTYVQEMPRVAKEVGEDVIPDIVESMMKLASHTSGSVITLMIANMPLAAQRLGDAELLRGFLKLLHQLAAKAPRGLRPMMEVLDELLSKLTLGGLRRWALWGAQAHQRDLEGQMAYFALKTDASKSVLQKERRGTLFVDNQRRLNFYLRALWGRAFLIRPTSGDYETKLGLKPYIENFQVHIPDAYDPFHGMTAWRSIAPPPRTAQPTWSTPWSPSRPSSFPRRRCAASSCSRTRGWNTWPTRSFRGCENCGCPSSPPSQPRMTTRSRSTKPWT